jgi:hypothetical protein
MRRALRGARCLRGRSSTGLTVGRVPGMGMSVARRSALLGICARHLARPGSMAAGMEHLLELLGALGEEDDGT